MVVEQGDSGTVVAAIFQSLQTFHDNRVGFPRSDISYNSTHNKFLKMIRLMQFRIHTTLQQDVLHEKSSHRKINNQASYIYQGCNEWCRGRSGISAQLF